MDIQELIEGGANVQIVIGSNDLIQIAELVIEMTKEQREREATMTADQVCKKLHVGLATLWRYRKQGRITDHKIGGRVLFSREEVEDAIAGGKTTKYNRDNEGGQ